jgi:hypothetical protein
MGVAEKKVHAQDEDKRLLLHSSRSTRLKNTTLLGSAEEVNMM